MVKERGEGRKAKTLAREEVWHRCGFSRMRGFFVVVGGGTSEGNSMLFIMGGKNTSEEKKGEGQFEGSLERLRGAG